MSRGPSDAFFRDTLKTVGGKLLGKLPDLEKRQAAAAALGAKVSLAEVAVQLELIDRAKLEELGDLEAGEKGARVPKAPPPPPPAPAPVPTGGRRRLRDRAKALSSMALAALRGSAKERVEQAQSDEAVTRVVERKAAFVVAGVLAVLSIVAAIAIVFGTRPSEPPPAPPPSSDAEVQSAAKAASQITMATTFGGDRDPNWWARRQASIDVPSSELVSDKPASGASGSGSDTLAAYVGKEHKVGPLRFKAHARWREVGATETSCTLVDDGSVVSVLVLLNVTGSKTSVKDLIDLTRRDLAPGARVSETKPCHERIGNQSGVGSGFDVQEDGFTVEVRVYEATIRGQRLLTILQAPGGTDARREITRILGTLE